MLYQDPSEAQNVLKIERRTGSQQGRASPGRLGRAPKRRQRSGCGLGASAGSLRSKARPSPLYKLSCPNQTWQQRNTMHASSAVSSGKRRTGGKGRCEH